LEATEPRKARAEVVKFYTNAKELNFPRKFFSQQRVGMAVAVSSGMGRLGSN